MPRLIWSPGALLDLARVRQFLAVRDEHLAKTAASTIREGLKILESHPYIGRPVDPGGMYRERIVPFRGSAYVILYRVEEGQVVILTLRHGRELEY